MGKGVLWWNCGSMRGRARRLIRHVGDGPKMSPIGRGMVVSMPLFHRVPPPPHPPHHGRCDAGRGLWRWPRAHSCIRHAPRQHKKRKNCHAAAGCSLLVHKPPRRAAFGAAQKKRTENRAGGRHEKSKEIELGWLMWVDGSQTRPRLGGRQEIAKAEPIPGPRDRKGRWGTSHEASAGLGAEHRTRQSAEE